MAHKGKFGWYPCDWATYQKLKKLNMVYDKALRSKARWDCWNRKEPQNRVSRVKLKDSSGRVVGYGVSVPLKEPEVCPIFCVKIGNLVKMVDLPIYQDYCRARYPVLGEEGVSGLSMSLELIEKLHNILKNNI